MRILQVIQEMNFGGAERIVVSLATGAARAGHHVAIAAAAGPLADEIDAPLFELPVLGRRITHVPGVARALRRAVRTWRPDVLHCHNAGMALVGGLVTRRGRSVPGLVSIHGAPARDYPRVAQIIRYSGFSSVACGPGVAGELEAQKLTVDHIIPNAVSPPPPPADRAALMKEWAISGSSGLVVSVGRLVPSKGHDVVMRAVALLPEVALAIIGGGPEHRHLQMEAVRLGVSDRVTIAGVRTDARAVMGAADVVVLGSPEQEGLPLVVLEAQAAGTPVVVGDITAIGGLVEDGVSGRVVPSDEVAFAEAIRGILQDPALARRLAAGGLAMAAAHPEAGMVARFLSLYRDLGDG